jgi:MFS family permease
LSQITTTNDTQAAELATSRPHLVVVSAIGMAQILAWGSSYYLTAVLAGPIAKDTGWARSWVVGALSIGLLVSGLVSPRVGHLIDRYGGRPVLGASAVLLACGLLTLGLAPTLPIFVVGWIILGFGMEPEAPSPKSLCSAALRARSAGL